MNSAAVLLLSVLLPSLAFAAPSAADRQAAKALHDQALKDYDLGRFADSIEKFSRAYDLVPDPVLLFDIAQAHSRNGDAERAIFFYRRFLATAPAASDRADVRDLVDDIERRVAELEKQVAARKATASPSPPPPRPAPAIRVEPSAAPADARFSFGIEGGISLLHVDARGVDRWDQPTAPLLRAGARYRVGRRLEVGVTGSVAPVAYWDQRRESRGGSLLTGLFAVAGGRTARGRFAVGADLGAGMLFWSGLGDGNPFTASPESTVALPSAQLGLALSYEMGGGLALRARSGYTVSSVGGTALATAARRVDQLELLLGIGYAMN